eukprot:TRINITY_DN62805_c0_g1_i1.p1 TRINITY_DN62805_c0_g1~~TRINITY_DN62805_c0_g1_i1.p1  ORF type:complete len:681 (-),score=156.17 TRINITY_DN62805_c0_g1_i1:63-2084(-)
MSDALVVSDPSQALVLADARHEHELAIYDAEGAKRKGKWASSVAAKKGKRWGLKEDKPFKPLPYVEIPVGLSDAEVDQFLREQRLEDLHKKIQLQQLEDVDPDIRPPSPPPLYDRQGNRLNTREIRVKKAMLAEYNRLIRYMVKNLQDYQPPENWRPQRLVKKVIIPYEKWPNASFMGVIIGARGVNHKRLQDATGCRIFIRGKDISDKFQTDEELQMPQHVHIEGDTEEQIEKASELLAPLLNPESPEFEYARTHGMQQVALVNGFTLKKSENRCGVCGALGHLGFDCPETEKLNYKMANVTCTICGDKGHVASDCKVAMEQHKKENVDWKEEAEKKRAMDAEYDKMMNELGLSSGKGTSKGNASATPSVGGAATASDGSANGAKAAAALLALPPSGKAPVLVRPCVQAPSEKEVALSAGGGSSSSVSVPTPPPPPAPRPPGQVQQPGLVSQHGQSVPVPKLVPPPPRPPRPQRPWGKGASLPADADISIACPRRLTQRLFSNGKSVLYDIGRETATRVWLHQRPDSEGGPCFAVTGSLEGREKAKLHLRAWLDVNSGGISGAPALQSPPWQQQSTGGGSVPPAGFPPAGFPPGFPPGMDSSVPDGFPPGFPPASGFPPAGFPPSFPPGMGAGRPSWMSEAPAPAAAFPAGQGVGPPSPPQMVMSAEAYDEI